MEGKMTVYIGKCYNYEDKMNNCAVVLEPFFLKIPGYSTKEFLSHHQAVIFLADWKDFLVAWSREGAQATIKVKIVENTKSNTKKMMLDEAIEYLDSLK